MLHEGVRRHAVVNLERIKSKKVALIKGEETTSGTGIQFPKAIRPPPLTASILSKSGRVCSPLSSLTHFLEPRVRRSNTGLGLYGLIERWRNSGQPELHLTSCTREAGGESQKKTMCQVSLETQFGNFTRRPLCVHCTERTYMYMSEPPPQPTRMTMPRKERQKKSIRILLILTGAINMARFGSFQKDASLLLPLPTFHFTTSVPLNK